MSGGLPIPVVYGAYLWPVGVLVVLAIGFRVIRMIRRSARRREVDAEVASRKAAMTAPVLARAEGEITIAGVLRGGSLSTLASAKEHHASAGDVWIEYEGERVALSAPARVVHGTHVEFGRRPPPSTPRAILEEQPRGDLHQLAVVRDGDTVIVSGVLGSEVAGVDRFGVRKRSLGPLPAANVIEVVAVSPTPEVRPLSLGAKAAFAVMFACVGAALLFGAGMLALDRASRWDANAPKRSGVIGTFDLAAIAAALPGARAEALAEIDRQLERRYEQTDAVRAQRAALAKLRGK